jgi:5'-nucleotidase
LNELCPWKPDLVLSGINGGLNAGVNVSYSGTVGAALAAATFGILSMAISIEYEADMDFAKAADNAWPIIEQFAGVDLPLRTAININIPTAALAGNADIALVPVETNPMGFHYARGTDPKGRNYFWSTNDPFPEHSAHETDTQALKSGKITVSAITYDLNSPTAMEGLRKSVPSRQETTN